LDEIQEAESGRHFFGQKHRLLVEDLYFGGENARRPTDNESAYRQVGSGTKLDK